jgi:hypothetical protein
VLREFSGYVPELLAERKSIYGAAETTPREHLLRLAAIDPASVTEPALEGAAALHR